MHFNDLIHGLIHDSGTSVGVFSPELTIVVTIVALLLVRLVDLDRRLPASIMALAGTVVGLVASAMQFLDFQGMSGGQHSLEFFTGLLLYDQFTVFFRVFLLLFLVFVICLTILSGIPDEEDAPDFYVLLLGATLGMMLMASANHLLIFFLSIEMASVPSYAMVGFLKGRKLSSEAALKYVVYGGGAAGVMLYGISLLAGMLGTAKLTSVGGGLSLATALTEFGAQHASFSDPAVRTLVLAILMVLVGIAFKLSAVPFHFWAPDAFEGASAEVGGFLSVASKGAAFGLIVRFCLAMVGPTDWGTGNLSSLYLAVGIGIGIIAALTATFGNLAAYAQTNVKRLLAYSTIAHAGYMLMAVAALMVILNAPAPAGVTDVGRKAAAEASVQGLLYYLAVYFFMNLGAFAVVALIRNKIFSEEMADYAGLGKQAMPLAVCMGVFLFSLVGLPPLGGFVGKFMVFAALFDAGSYHASMWALLVVGGVNTVFSLFYYLRVLKFMFLEPLPDGARVVDIPLGSNAGWYVAILSLPVLGLGTIFIEPISRVARDVAHGLF